MTLMSRLRSSSAEDRPRRYPNAVPVSKLKPLGDARGDRYAEFDGAEWKSARGLLSEDDAKSLLGRPDVMVVSEQRAGKLEDGTLLIQSVARRYDLVQPGTYRAELAIVLRRREKDAARDRRRPIPTGGHGLFSRRREVWAALPDVRPDVRPEPSASQQPYGDPLTGALAAGYKPAPDPSGSIRVEGRPAAHTPGAVLAACRARGIELSVAAGDRLFIKAPRGRLDPATRADLQELAPMLVLHLQGAWAQTPCARPDHAKRPAHPVGAEGLTFDLGVFGCVGDETP